MKNHTLVNGYLKQNNKKFSQLKAHQKAKISEWFYESYASLAKEDGTLLKSDKEEVCNLVNKKIEDSKIWIPFDELVKYFEKKRNVYRKRYLKQLKQSN